MDGSTSSLRAVLVLTVMTSLFSVTVSEGQTTSITSSGLGTTISPPSIDPAGRPNYTITGGTRPGDGPNLFHSFGDFSVGTNNVARFFNETGRATTNILSRVTGGQTSNIYGTIQTAGFGAAALWLINPAGIVFGPTASLNVGGSVHFSTADYLRLGSGNDRFYADLGKTSQLTSAPVTAFGFLSPSPTAITVNESGLAVPDGQTLSLIGGPGTFTDKTTGEVPLGVSLSAPGGQINIARVGHPLNPTETVGGEVALSGGASPALTPIRLSDLITIILNGVNGQGEGASITRGGNGTPAVLIRGGQLMLDGSSAGSVVNVNTLHSVDGIDVRVGTLIMNPGSIMSASTGANTSIDATNTVIISGGVIRGGNVSVASPILTLQSGQVNPTSRLRGEIITSTEFSDSRAGDIILNVGSLLVNKGTIRSQTFGGTGDAGKVSIAANIARFENNGVITVQANSGTRNVGSINMAVNELMLSGQSLLSAVNDGNGSGGSINIQGKDTVSANSVMVSNQSRIIASTSGRNKNADPGRVLIIASEITVREGGAIEAETGIPIRTLEGEILPPLPVSTMEGRAGDIVINGRRLLVLNKGRINSDSYNRGAAGSIILNVDDLMVASEGKISTSSISAETLAGSAGKISINGFNGSGTASQMISIDNGTVSTTVSGGSSTTDSATIDVTAQAISLANGAHIKSDSTGEAPAGNVNFISDDNIFITNSTVSTAATQASGGNIEVTAPNMVRLVGANLTSSVAGPPGSNGGNITIDTAHPQFVVMQGNSQILAKANEGQGGAITIIGGVVLQEPGSVLDATAGPAGISGTVNIQAPIQQLSGAIAPLPQAFAVATNLYGQRCATQKGGQFSSFVQGARDGVPPQPGDLIPSPFLLELDEAAFNRGAQSTSSLAAIRLGLPAFEQTSPSSLTVFTGCRS